MDNSKYISESATFFALKKSIHLINVISNYLSKEQKVSWNDVIKYQEDAQHFINSAIKTTFPNDDLSSYRLNLPSSIKENSAENEEHFDPYGLKLYSYTDDAEISNIKLENSKPTLTSSITSTDELSTDVGYYRESSVRSATEPQNNSLFESEDELNSSGVNNFIDNLTEARTKYMNLINSNESYRFDSSVSNVTLNSKTSYLFENNFPFSSKVHEVNKNVFGFNSFRGVQLPAINAIMLGLDCMLMMATGVGKSHCYQLPSLLLNGTVIVFSPLLSLVEDQIQSLRSHGIDAETLNSKTPAAEYRAIVKSQSNPKRSFLNGNILFITPEKFDKSKSVLNLLEKMYEMNRLKLFVIDEAHCVSQWGHSFRKDYRKLCNLKHKFPDVPILAMTATATLSVIDDITSVLGFQNHALLRTTINRPNLWLEVREKNKNYMDEILEILNSTTGCAIIYCLTTSDCEKIAEKLVNHGISVTVYHARMHMNDRLASQNDWKSGAVRIIVATVAFGMGIDKPDVRLILHTSAPTSILSYYQEIGRAGRDGKFAITILWYSTRDFERHKNINESKHNSTSLSYEMRDFCMNRTTCRRKMILEAFGEEPTFSSCLGCDNCCLNLIRKLTDVTEEATIILKFVQESMEFRNKGFLTANILSDAVRGSKNLHMAKYRLTENSYHGALKSRTKKFIIIVLLEMVKLKILKELRRRSKSFGRTVLIEGSNSQSLLNGKLKVQITCYQEPTENNDLKIEELTGLDESLKSSESVKESESSRISIASTKSSVKKSGKKKSPKSKNSSLGSKSDYDMSYYSKDNIKELIEDCLQQDDVNLNKLIDLTLEYEKPFGWNNSNSNYSNQITNELNGVENDLDIVQSQGCLTQSDMITIEANNLRRKVPGTAVDSTQSLA